MKSSVKIAEMMQFLPAPVRDAVHAAAKAAGHPTDDLELRRCGHSEKARTNQLDAGSRKAMKYVSTRTVDRDREIVMPVGMDLTEFRKYAHVLVNHNYSLLPVGSDESIEADGYGIKALTVYADTGEGTLANVVWRLVQQGHMKASSVGFVPVEWTSPGDRAWDRVANKLSGDWAEFNKEASYKRIITKGILLEHSDVSVPCNADAITQSVAKSMGIDEKLAGQLGWVVKGGVVVPPRDEIPIDVRPIEKGGGWDEDAHPRASDGKFGSGGGGRDGAKDPAASSGGGKPAAPRKADAATAEHAPKINSALDGLRDAVAELAPGDGDDSDDKKMSRVYREYAKVQEALDQGKKAGMPAAEVRRIREVAGTAVTNAAIGGFARSGSLRQIDESRPKDTADAPAKDKPPKDDPVSVASRAVDEADRQHAEVSAQIAREKDPAKLDGLLLQQQGTLAAATESRRRYQDVVVAGQPAGKPDGDKKRKDRKAPTCKHVGENGTCGNAECENEGKECAGPECEKHAVGGAKAMSAPGHHAADGSIDRRALAKAMVGLVARKGSSDIDVSPTYEHLAGHYRELGVVPPPMGWYGRDGRAVERRVVKVVDRGAGRFVRVVGSVAATADDIAEKTMAEVESRLMRATGSLGTRRL